MSGWELYDKNKIQSENWTVDRLSNPGFVQTTNGGNTNAHSRVYK